MNARPVLLIDNDAAWCERACRFLASLGVESRTAQNEAAALQTLADIHRPAAILIDPASVDPAFCHFLRELPELDGVPVIVVSDAPARTVYNRHVGNSGYVRKAVAFEHLSFLLGDVIAGQTAAVPAHVFAA